MSSEPTPPATSSSESFYLSGIDEAGYGPLLGPLVIGCTTLRLPSAIAPAAPWKLLAPAVRRHSAKGIGIAIADSKKLHRSGTNDLSPLEIGALAFVACERGGECPRTFRELMDHLTVGRCGYLEDYPWYRGQDVALPYSAPALALAGATRRLARSLERTHTEVAEVRALPLEVTEFNAHLATQHNKGEVNAWAVGRFVRWLWRQRERKAAEIWVDRLGGRLRYGPLLYPLLRGARFQILEQETERQSYEAVEDASGRCLRIHFMTEGEKGAFPTALASMTAKYVRELHMVLFNRWWRAQATDPLEPTAGYPQDARRFLDETATLRSRLGIDPAVLIRLR
ncbi:MAG: hypothetical protein AB7O52_05275 [Planctomycetota bacterium]